MKPITRRQRHRGEWRRRTYLLRVLILLLGAAGTWLSLEGNSDKLLWVTVTTAIAAAFTAYLEYRRVEPTAASYSEAAENLGVDLGRLRQTAIAGAALAVGAATAVAGTIGFVGLVVPHLLRPFVGHQPSRLLPASLLGGAILVLAADIALRVLTPAGELRLGVVTALIGTPLFLWLVHQTRRELAP